MKLCLVSVSIFIWHVSLSAQVSWDGPFNVFAGSNSSFEYRISYTNGPQPFKIYRIEKDCGCYSVLPEKADVGPLQSGTITFQFRSVPGVTIVRRTALIYTNEMGNLPVRVDFNILQSRKYVIDPPSLVWNNGERDVKQVEIVQLGDDFGYQTYRQKSGSWKINHKKLGNENRFSVTPRAFKSFQEQVFFIFTNSSGLKEEVVVTFRIQ